MSNNKKIRSRLDQLFTDIKDNEKEQTTPSPKKGRRIFIPEPASPTAPVLDLVEDRQSETGAVTGYNELSAPIPETKRQITLTDVSPKLSGMLMTIPFQTGDDWNLIQLEKEAHQHWKKEDQLLVKQIVDQLGLALQNAHLFGETQKSAGQMASVAEIATKITSILDLQPLIETAVQLTQRRFSLYHAHIFLFDRDLNTLRVKACGWEENDIHQGAQSNIEIKLNAPISIVARAARERKPVVDNDVLSDPTWLPNPMLPNVQSELAIPVLAGEQVLGVLNVHSDKLNFFSPADVSIMTTLAAQIGSAIQNARLFDETQKHTRELATLNEIVQIVSEQIGLKQVLDAAYQQIKKLVPVDGFIVALVDEESNTLTYPLLVDEGIYFDEKPIPLQPGSFTAESILTGKIIQYFLTPEQAAAEEAKIGLIGNTSTPTRSSLYFPLKSGTKVIGCLSVQSYESNAYKTEEITLLENITNQLAVGIRNAQLLETTQINEENFRNLIENAPEAIVVVDVTSGLFMESNTNACKLFGLSPEELIKISPLDVSPDRNPVQNHLSIGEVLQDAINDKSPVFEWSVINASGQIIPCEIHLSHLPSERPLVRATLIDITERKKAEEEISKFKMGIEQSGDAVFMTDTSGTIIYVNPAFTTIYGFTEQDALGSNPRIIQSGLMSKEDYKYFWDTLLSKGMVTDELVNRAKDGRLLYIAGTNSPILSPSGNILGFLAVHHDISETKKAQEALQQNEEALRRQNDYLATAAEVSRLVTSTLDLETLFSRTVDLIRSRFGYYFVSIFTIDEDGTSAILREGTGTVGEEMKRRKHNLAIGSRSIIGTATASGKTVIANNTAINPNHRPNPLLPETRAEAGIPLSIGSRIIGALDIQSKEIDAFRPDDIAVLETLADQISVALENANSYDIAQKAYTEMRELDRIKSQFLANMSHELRTPLNSIIGFSRVIMKGIDGPVSEQQQQDLSAIYNSGQHLLGLINNILDLSKIDAGKMELSLEELSISDTINSVVATATGLVRDKPVKLKTDFEPNLPTVRADPMRIRQVLLNLISNASKFTEEGCITVSARENLDSKGQKEMLVSVTDTGPGISAEDQTKLFLAFSQVDSSPTRKTGGTGLGLSISERLVSLHGGKIGVTSGVGKGSTFYFTVPLYHQPQAEHPAGDNCIILCVEDDPQIVTLYERYLQPQGYQVVPVNNPANARDMAKRIQPYAITLDIMMPGIDGWSVLEQLKSDPETRNIPVIVCSIIEEEEKGFSLGAADYLVKPIMEDVIVAALDRLNGNGMIKDVLIIDDSPDDLRLMEKIIKERSNFRPILASSGEQGWEILNKTLEPGENGITAVILDLFMPDINGFTILERLRTSEHLRDLPVVVVSGVDLTSEQKKLLDNLGKHMLQKGMLSHKDLFTHLEKSLNRFGVRQASIQGS